MTGKIGRVRQLLHGPVSRVASRVGRCWLEFPKQSLGSAEIMHGVAFHIPDFVALCDFPTLAGDAW